MTEREFVIKPRSAAEQDLGRVKMLAGVLPHEYHAWPDEPRFWLQDTICHFGEAIARDDRPADRQKGGALLCDYRLGEPGAIQEQ